MFITALIVIVKVYNQSMCSSINEWIKYVCIYVCIYNIIRILLSLRYSTIVTEKGLRDAPWSHLMIKIFVCMYVYTFIYTHTAFSLSVYMAIKRMKA